MAMDAGLLLPLNEYKEILPSIFQTEYYEKAVDYSREYNSGKTGKFIYYAHFHRPCLRECLQLDAHAAVGYLQESRKAKGGNAGGLSGCCGENGGDQAIHIKTGRRYTDFHFIPTGINIRFWRLRPSLISTVLTPSNISPLMETNVLTKATSSILDENSFYKRALHFYYEANQRGLLDPDSRTQSYSNLEKKIQSGADPVLLVFLADRNLQ